VGSGPLLEGAGRVTGEVLVDGEDDGVVEGSLGVEVEEGVDILAGHGCGHFGAGLVIGLCFEAQLSPEHLSEDPHPVGGQERLRSGDPVGLARVAGGRERQRGDRGDVGRVDMATRTEANGARTRSPAASWGAHSRVFDMKPLGRMIVAGRPAALTASSEAAI
jgi:hypothetical protein